MKKGLILVRKQGKLPGDVKRLNFALEYGTTSLEMQPGTGSLLIVDDVLATGGTLRAAADLGYSSRISSARLCGLNELSLFKSIHLERTDRAQCG